MPVNGVGGEEQCCCCEKSGENCCCSASEVNLPGEASPSGDKCSCKIATMPFLPDEPYELLPRRADHESDQMQIECDGGMGLSPVLDNHASFRSSLPPVKSVPIFIKNTALLI